MTGETGGSDTSKLTIAVDSTSAVQAAKDLDTLAASGDRAQASVGRVGESADKGFGQATSAAREMDASIARAREGLARLAAQMAHNRDSARTSGEALQLFAKIDPVGTKLARLDELQSQLNRLSRAGRVSGADLAAMTDILESRREVIAKAGQEIEKTSGFLGGLSLTSGTAAREYGVLTHELATGNFSRFEGSLITLSNRIGLLPKLMSATGAAVLLTAAAFATLAISAVSSANEEEKFNTAVIRTGNIAGETYSDVLRLAKGMQSSSESFGMVKSALLATVESGRFFNSEITKVAKGVADFSILTGESVDKAAKEFEKLKDDPLRAVDDLDKSMHFLTDSTRTQIFALTEQGDKEGAFKIALDATTKAINQRVSEVEAGLPPLIQMWHDVRDAASEAWTTMGHALALKIGLANETHQEALQSQEGELLSKRMDAQTALDNLRQQNPNNYAVHGTVAQAIAEKQAEIRDLDKQIAAIITQSHQDVINAERAAAAAEREQMAKDANAWLQEHEKEFRTRQERRQAEIAWFTQQYGKLTDAQLKERGVTKSIVDGEPVFSGGTYDRDIADISQKYKDAKTKMSDADKEAKKAAAAHAEEIKVLNKAIADHTAVVNGTAEADTKLSEQERWAKQLKADLGLATDHLTKKEKDYYKQLIDNIVAIDKENQAKAQSTLLTEENTHAVDEARKAGDKRAESDARELRALTLTSEQNRVATRIDQIRDDFLQRRIALKEYYFKKNATGSQEELQGIEDLETEEQKQLNQEKNFQEQRLRLQQDYSAGAKRALDEYREKALDVNSAVHDATANALSGMEDALVQFVTTGKANFKSLALSILADLARIEIRILLSNVLGNIFGGGGGGGILGGGSGGGIFGGGSSGGGIFSMSDLFGSANGNVFNMGDMIPFGNGGVMNSPTVFQMAGGKTGIMSEFAPEAIMPLKRGPNGLLGVAVHDATGGAGSGGKGHTFNLNTTVVIADGQATAKTTGDQTNQARQLADLMSATAQKEIMRQLRPGGILWGMGLRGS